MLEQPNNPLRLLLRASRRNKGAMILWALVGMLLMLGVDWLQHGGESALERYLVPSIIGLAIGSLLFLVKSLISERQDRLAERLFENQRLLKKLKQSEEDFRQLAEGSVQGILVADADRKPLFANGEFVRIFGFANKDELLALGCTIPLIAPYEMERLNNIRTPIIEGQQEPTRYEFDGVKKDGSIIRLMCIGGRVDWRGQRAVYLTVYDISFQREAEERLRRAQKMEAVGQLTGGVAHDFNNLLAVIQGCAEFLEEEPGHDKEMVQGILRASQRGAELTHRLLAYSRQQPLAPKPIDPAALAVGMEGMLERSLGETIDLEIIPTPDLWLASADPGQVEDALLNLALNSRDAMPAGGKLTIQCANVTLDDESIAMTTEYAPGDYVMLSVTDTGEGMSDAVKKQVFEPFFTTKEVGKGSGLGLSMVYGFARQSGGHINVYSEVGIGTTVSLFLPRANSGTQRPEEQGRVDIPKGTGETVLVIEDDPAVRNLLVRTLAELGFQTREAGHVAAAKSQLQDGQHFDLILSDIVLPGGVSGPEFAEEVRERNPDAKIIFMSGYPAESAIRSGFSNAGEVLLNKPFRREELAEKLCEVMEIAPG